jgi:hypothetical protein
MGWIIGIAIYAVLLTAVVLIAGGRRRGDLRHAATINDLAAFDTAELAYTEPSRLRVATGSGQRI